MSGFGALEMVKSLDPVGCASSSLSECLLAQARVLEVRMPLVEEIIKGHLEDFQKQFNAQPVPHGFRYTSGENSDFFSVEQLRNEISSNLFPSQ